MYDLNPNVEADDGDHSLLLLEMVRGAQAAKLELDLRVVRSEETNEEDKVEMKSHVDCKEVPAHQLYLCHLVLRAQHS